MLYIHCIQHIYIQTSLLQLISKYHSSIYNNLKEKQPLDDIIPVICTNCNHDVNYNQQYKICIMYQITSM